MCLRFPLAVQTYAGQSVRVHVVLSHVSCFSKQNDVNVKIQVKIESIKTQTPQGQAESLSAAEAQVK